MASKQETTNQPTKQRRGKRNPGRQASAPASLPKHPKQLKKESQTSLDEVTLGELLAFAIAAEHNQYIAADETGNSQGNISKLERALSHLFGGLHEPRRDGKRLLTPRGRRLHARIRDLVDLCYELAHPETVWLGYTRPALPLVARVVGQLTPNFTFHVEELESSQIATRLARGSLDMGIAYGVPAFEALTTESESNGRKGAQCEEQRLHESPLLLLRPRGYDKKPLSALADLTYMSFDPALDPIHTQKLKGWLRARGVCLDREQAVVRAGEKALYVAMGRAFGFTPEISCDPLYEKLGIVAHRVPKLPRAPLNAYYLKNRRLDLGRVLQSFQEHAKSAFPGVAAEDIERNGIT